MTAGKRSELESFWRAHLDGWRRSDLNQREYCELHGLPLKRFGNWRAKLKHENPTSAGKLLYRRGGALSHMTKGAVPASASHIPSTWSTPPGKRRRFSEADKRRIVEEADRPGASVSDVALVVEAHVFLVIADLHRALADLADLRGVLGREGLGPLVDQVLTPFRRGRRVETEHRRGPGIA
jgi:hypothetical protein